MHSFSLSGQNIFFKNTLTSGGGIKCPMKDGVTYRTRYELDIFPLFNCNVICMFNHDLPSLHEKIIGFKFTVMSYICNCLLLTLNVQLNFPT